MSESLHYICRARATGIDHLVSQFEAWRKDHAEAMAVRDVEDWIAALIREINECILLSKEIRRRFFANQLGGDVEELGDCVLSVLKGLVESIEAMTTAGKRLEEAGYTVENMEQLNAARQRLLRATDNFAATWPRINMEMWEKTAKDIDKGNFQSTEEILRELQSDNP